MTMILERNHNDEIDEDDCATGEVKLRYSLYNHQSVLPKDRIFTAKSGTKVAVLPKGRSSAANSGTKVAFLLGMHRCRNFPLLFAPYSLFSI